MLLRILKPSKGIDGGSNRRSVLDDMVRPDFFEKVAF